MKKLLTCISVMTFSAGLAPCLVMLCVACSRSENSTPAVPQQTSAENPKVGGNDPSSIVGSWSSDRTKQGKLSILISLDPERLLFEWRDRPLKDKSGTCSYLLMSSNFKIERSGVSSKIIARLDDAQLFDDTDGDIDDECRQHARDAVQKSAEGRFEIGFSRDTSGDLIVDEQTLRRESR